jgi:capsular exopolysaccharide synthesis family protein
MSRFYDALKKAEGQLKQERRVVVGPVAGRTLPHHVWNLDDQARLEYERIQVWIANHSPSNQPIQTVMVVPCKRGNGATTTAVRLASTLAQRPTTRVLLVDANLRTPCLDLLFGARNTGGFSELVSNGGGNPSSYIQAAGRPNMFVLTTGVVPRSPLDTLSTAGLTRVLAQLKSRFDYVVLDAPSLLDFPDAYAMAPHVDAVLLVVEADRTLVDDARRVVRQLERAGARAAGVVLNRHRDHMPRLLRRLLFRGNGLRPARA